MRTGSSQQSQKMSCFVLALLAQPLGADSQGSAWNFCAPAVDYDSMRKEAATIFTEKRAEVQQMVGVKWLEAHATDSNVLSSSRLLGSARASKIKVVVQLCTCQCMLYMLQLLCCALSGSWTLSSALSVWDLANICSGASAEDHAHARVALAFDVRLSVCCNGIGSDCFLGCCEGVSAGRAIHSSSWL